MQPVTHAPAGAASVVSGSPTGTLPPPAGHTPNASPPPKSTVCSVGSVLTSDHASVSLWLKPTLTCLTASASANTYTSYAPAAGAPENATTAGGRSSVKYTGGAVTHGEFAVGTHPRSA